MSNYHCPEYEELTIENKLLVDKEIKKWFKEFDNTCVPMFMFKLAEEWIIEELKRKERNDKRNRKSSAGRTNHK